MDAEINSHIHYLRPVGKGIKIHLGCGDYWYDGYLNIDVSVYGGTDMLWDIRTKLPFQDKVVEIIECHDVLEHFNREEVQVLLAEWKRLLIDGGRIAISLPDMDALVAHYSVDKEKAIQYIYGITDHPSHKWGYTQETLKKLFEDAGFKNVIVLKGEVAWRKGEAKLLLSCEK